ncbi:PEST proteolytic signal-containing nuclear protein-like isoform X2 [Hoplias malabaricus]|uniref:PEST proteolytic signal-containing nuclear protein-like isoform X2 n=1 Tax=Hoplias malabaricus TaxID=27720 RepID=UPI003462DEF7
MANDQQRDGAESGGGGAERKGGSVKSGNTVSSSTGKRPAATSSGSSSSSNSEDHEHHPVPPKITKLGFSMAGQSLKKAAPISIKLGASKPKEVAPVLPVKKPAAVFDDDDDSEPEEMPPEAKMRMKNIGRDTPTSAGPNSFNKGKQGFSDHQKLWERKLKAHTDQ